MKWRYWLDGARSGAGNMALDHALAEAAETSGEAVVRFYTWERPTLSFGRNEPAAGVYDREEIERRGLGVVRRPTGGRAVLHDDEITYLVMVGRDGWTGVRELYRRVNRGLVQGLRDLGVPVDLARGRERAPGPAEGPCFRLAVDDEVTLGGRKLVGSAQARIGRAILQHGSLILGGTQRTVAELRGEEPEGDSATLAETDVSVPSLETLAEALRHGLAGELGGTWVEGGPNEVELEAAERLELRYASADWTWRR